MSDPISDVKAFITAQLGANCEPVPPKTSASNKVHLSVWHTRGKRRPIGVELDHKTVVNLWIWASEAPANISGGVKITRKAWTGEKWASPDGKGANSNLRGYEDFHGHDLIRLGVKTQADAEEILTHLLT